MFRLSVFIIILFTNLLLNAQITINSTENPRATLDVVKEEAKISSISQGFMFPSFSTQERNLFQNPPLGLMIFNTDTNTIDVYAGEWKSIDLSTIANAKGGVTPTPETPDEPITDFRGKSVWVYGASDIQFSESTLKREVDYSSPEKFPKGQWFQMENNDKVQYLVWDNRKKFRWFDCNKVNASGIKPGVDEKDNNYCWACTASGTLSWWLHFNRDYIEKYREKYPDAKEWEKYPDTDNIDTGVNEIYKFFKRYTKNAGGFASNAINWFVRGNPKDIYFYNTTWGYDFKGFFRNVFEESVEISTWTKAVNKKSFNDIIKSALANKSAISFDVGYGGSPHAMNIWGADFDEKGEITHIYYSDSNDGANFEDGTDFERRRLKREKVFYAEYGTGQYAYTTVSISRGNAPITTLHTISLRRDVWAKEFDYLPLPKD